MKKHVLGLVGTSLLAIGCSGGDPSASGDGDSTTGEELGEQEDGSTGVPVSGPADGGGAVGNQSTGEGGTGAVIAPGTGGDSTVCPVDECGGECVDTWADNANCGACGSNCQENETCIEGSCFLQSCGDGLQLCGQECLDTQNDPLNCGDCGVLCGVDEVCAEGSCADLGIPQVDYCAETIGWEEEWIELEYQVLELVNQRRAEGANCNSNGVFAPAGPLEMDPTLRCAARVHSKDMADRDFFDHDNPDGEGPGPRVDAAGYTGRGWGENIAAGQRTPESVMEGWMASDGHCSNIMNPNRTVIGVGYFPSSGSSSYSRYWTQVFGLY